MKLLETKKLLCAMVIFGAPLSVNATEDLGTYGPLYPVKEKNIKVVIKKALKSKEKEIEEMAKEIIDNGLVFKSSLPFSKENKTIEQEFFPDVKNKPHHPKDEICVVSFDGFKVLDELISRFGKKCRYVFLNTDIRKISSIEKYNDIDKYIGNDIFFNMFNVEATPVKITLENGMVTYKYLDYKEILAKVKNDLLMGK